MKDKSASRPLRVGLISLGCAKNLVDAEIMLGSLLKSGVEITNDAEQADAVVGRQIGVAAADLRQFTDEQRGEHQQHPNGNHRRPRRCFTDGWGWVHEGNLQDHAIKNHDEEQEG